MRLPVNLSGSSKYNRVKSHILFWTMAILATTFFYGTNLPGYLFALKIVVLCFGAQFFYFYTVAYIGVPKLLFRRKYVAFILFLAICTFIATVMFRLSEILIVDPMIQDKIRETNPAFTWRKLKGTFQEQFFSMEYFITAMEQATIAVWIGLAVKFFKMYYIRNQVAMQAELDFLKGQVHPHFLFNTLNNLYALTLKQSPQSPVIVLGLADILRYMLYECNADRVMLQRDVEILESYVSLEKLRYEERLDLTFSINGDLSEKKIAPLLIMPLIENAFKHGASEDIDTPWINISLQVKDNILKCKVANSKPALKPADAEKHYGKIGLRNVRKRLELLYPESHLLRTVEEDDTFIAVMELQLDRHINMTP